MCGILFVDFDSFFVLLWLPKIFNHYPVLNGARDVYGYIDTLKKQKFSNWESIIVDDGSTDGTIAMLNKCIAGDKRFYVVCNTLEREIPGPYQARNFGLKIAHGDFICFLDIDDRWLPDKLEIQSKQLKSNPEYCLLYSPYIRKTWSFFRQSSKTLAWHLSC